MHYEGKVGRQWRLIFFIGMYSEKSLKNLLFKNQYARKAVTCFEASSGRLE